MARDRTKYITAGELARDAGMDTSMVQRAFDAGTLAGIRTAGGHRWIERASAREWLDDMGFPVPPSWPA